MVQRLGLRTFDPAVVGSIPGRGIIKAHWSTQPSIPPGPSGVGKSSTSLTGWGVLAYVGLHVKLCDT